MKIPEVFLNDERFVVEGDKIKLVQFKSNFVFYICNILAIYAMIIAGFIFTQYASFLYAIYMWFILIIGTLFFGFATIPMVKKIFRNGRESFTIENGYFSDGLKKVKLDQIVSIKSGKHPNPLRLWVFDYLIITDKNKKKHYLNTFNLASPQYAMYILDYFALGIEPTKSFKEIYEEESKKRQEAEEQERLKNPENKNKSSFFDFFDD